MGALIEVNTDGLAKLAETVGGWLGLNARAIEQNAEALAFATVRKVDAENVANLARLEGEEQVANYIIAREKRKMNNAKSVVQLAQTQFVKDEQVSSEPVNPDWINRFFTIVEDISDVEMQQLWARILAGEVKNPKSYSLRTLEILRNITKEEAEQITKASCFLLHNNTICSEKFCMDLKMQSLMDELGLICGEALIRTYAVSAEEPCNIAIANKHILSLHSDFDIKINLQCYLLTKAGQEVFALTQEDNHEFIVNLAKHFKEARLSKVLLNKIVRWEGDSSFCIPEHAVEI